MFICKLLTTIFFIISTVLKNCQPFTSSDFHNHWAKPQPPPPAPPKTAWELSRLYNIPTSANNQEPLRTRSLTGGTATNGNNVTNGNVLELVKIGLLGGYAIRRIKMFNNRVYLTRYRRSYWFGTRYYAIDNHYFLETRDTCAYRMNETERENLEYEEDGEPILEIIYQCQRYAQYCCGLDCCQQVDKRWTNPEQGVQVFNKETKIMSNSFTFLITLALSLIMVIQKLI